jgi:hypothetical protein
MKDGERGWPKATADQEAYIEKLRQSAGKFDPSVRVGGPTKRCTRCGVVKPLDRFMARKDGHGDGLHPWCRKCRTAHNVAWRSHRRATDLAFREQEKKRAAEYGRRKRAAHLDKWSAIAEANAAEADTAPC